MTLLLAAWRLLLLPLSWGAVLVSEVVAYKLSATGGASYPLNPFLAMALGNVLHLCLLLSQSPSSSSCSSSSSSSSSTILSPSKDDVQYVLLSQTARVEEETDGDCDMDVPRPASMSDLDRALHAVTGCKPGSLTPDDPLRIGVLVLAQCVSHRLLFHLFLLVEPSALCLSAAASATVSAALGWSASHGWQREVGLWSLALQQCVALLLLLSLTHSPSSSALSLLLVLTRALASHCRGQLSASHHSDAVTIQEFAVPCVSLVVNVSLLLITGGGGSVVLTMAFSPALLQIVAGVDLPTLTVHVGASATGALQRSVGSAGAAAVVVLFSVVLGSCSAPISTILAAALLGFASGEALQREQTAWADESVDRRSGGPTEPRASCSAAPQQCALVCACAWVLGTLLLSSFSRSSLLPTSLALVPLPWRSPDARPRVAHCFMGHARTMWFPEIAEYYRRNVLSPMDDAEHDLFLIAGYEPSSSHGRELESWSKDKYSRALAELAFKRVVWLNEAHNYSLPEHDCPYGYWSICDSLVREHEREGGFSYRHVIRTRPDTLVLSRFPRASELPMDVVGLPPYWECAGNMGEKLSDSGSSSAFHTVSDKGWARGAWCEDADTARSNRSQYGLNDLFAVLPRPYASVYLNTAAHRWNESMREASCGRRHNDCECNIKVSLSAYRVLYEAWPIFVKIRRSFQMCEAGEWNRFNTVC